MARHALKTLAAGSAILLTSIGFTADPANAGSRSYGQVKAMSHATPATITSPGEGVNARSIEIPYGKSTVVDLPSPMMDVIVSNPDVVEAIVHTANRVVLIGKQAGQANAFFYGQNGSELLNLEIRVDRHMQGLKSLLSKHVPGADVDVQGVNGNILLTGAVDSASAASQVEAITRMWLDEEAGGAGPEGEVVNLLAIRGKDQVLLKVRIVEMQRSVTKQMGINLNAIGQLGDSTVSLLSNSALQTGAGFSGAVTYNNTTGGSLQSLTGALQALERVGLIRTLAEPTLTAISGETANFLSGGEFPLLTNVFIDENGNLQREFEFKPYGVSLGFTPNVLSEGRISLNISTEVSEPTTEGAFETGGVSSDILGLRVRRANTVVELPAGGSLVIAGLIREESRQSIDGTPVLKDIPGLGAAFRNRDDLTTQTELVVMVTPYLVDPTHPDKLQTPLDGHIPANDKDALLLGRLNKVYGDNAAKISEDYLEGPFGHVVD